MKPSNPTVNTQLLVEQIRNEIEERKGDLAAEARAKAASSAQKANHPPLKVAMIALGRAKSKLQAAKKWPVFIRFVRCNYHAVGGALVDAVRNIAEEAGKTQKSLAALDSRHNSLSRKHAMLSAVQEEMRNTHEHLESGSDNLQGRLEALETDYRQLADRHAVLVSEQDERRRELGTRLTYLEGAFHLVEQHFAGAFQLIVKQLGTPERPVGLSLLMTEDDMSGKLDAHRFDAFYLAFEDQFRGSRDLVKERLLQYLPILEALKLRIPDAVGVDVGCGRGEWLETLKEQGIAARGVDLNPLMIERCRALGLNAEEGDCIAFLRGLPDHSVAVVSGFHIAEHLPLGRLLELFQQAHRILRPGGIAIFETPNPEVLRVATYTFYFDPTHLNPLPPDVLSFIGTHTGFSEVTVERFQPLVENGEMKGYMDYACICTK